MAHDSTGKYEKKLAHDTAASLIADDLRKGFQAKYNDSLMKAADKRRAAKKAAEKTKRYYHEHRAKVLLAEAILVVLTFGGIRMFRNSRRNKS